MIEYKILKLGKLKFNRLKSMSILRKEINSFGYDFSYNEVKELFESLINGNFTEQFDLKFKMCFDIILIDNEYETLGDVEEAVIVIHYDYIPCGSK